MKQRRRSSLPEFRVIDLPRRHEGSYLVCLEDWSDEMREAGDAKERWFERMKERGLRVKLAVDELDHPLGMIQYLPIQESIADGSDLYMILCIWVLGYDEAEVGNVQHGGIGTELLAAAELDVRSLGAKGMAAWGVRLPFWMRSSWFKRQGYRTADRNGAAELVWKPFTDDAQPPRWIPSKPVGEAAPGRVAVTAFQSGWCPAMNLVCERAERVAGEFGSAVEFSKTDTSDHQTAIACGHCDGVFLDGRPLQRGAPPSMATIRRRIKRRVARRRRGATRRATSQTEGER